MQINYVGHNARMGFAVVDIHTNGHYHIMFFEKGVVQFFQERQAKSCEFNIDELIEFCKSKLPQAPVAGKETANEGPMVVIDTGFMDAKELYKAWASGTIAPGKYRLVREDKEDGDDGR